MKLILKSAVGIEGGAGSNGGFSGPTGLLFGLGSSITGQGRRGAQS